MAPTAGGLDRLVPVLEDARAVGLLGPGPVDAHIRHAQAFGEAHSHLLAGAGGPDDHHGHPPASGPSVDTPLEALDLGSGAGVPGLVLALLWPHSHWSLLDAGHRRCDFLRQAVSVLDLDTRAEVVEGRAEEIGRDPRHRGRYQLVTARGFAPPGVTAECAAPLLAIGGCLLVSEPPEPDPKRWSESGLADLGLESVIPAAGAMARIFAVRQIRACPDRYPRRTGIPNKRPLF